MQFRIIDGITPAASTKYQGSLRSADFDHILVYFEQADNANSCTFAESDLITFNCTLRKIDTYGNRVEKMILEGARLEDMAKYTNSQGGIGQIPGTNNPTAIFAFLPVGRIRLEGDEELTMTVSFGAVGTLTTPVLYVYAIKTHSDTEPIRKYISFNNQSVVSFNNCIELYSAGVSGAGQAGNTHYISDGYLQQAVLDTISWALEMASGRFEEDESTTTWFLDWVDDTDMGKTLSVRSPANTELFAVCLVD